MKHISIILVYILLISCNKSSEVSPRNSLSINGKKFNLGYAYYGKSSYTGTPPFLNFREFIIIDAKVDENSGDEGGPISDEWVSDKNFFNFYIIYKDKNFLNKTYNVTDDFNGTNLSANLYFESQILHVGNTDFSMKSGTIQLNDSQIVIKGVMTDGTKIDFTYNGKIEELK